LAQQNINVPEFWQKFRRALSEQFEGISSALGGYPLLGATPEAEFRKLFSTYLPRRYLVEPGFVINAKGDRSSAMDLLIVDNHNVPPLLIGAEFSVFATESVAAAMEITASPKTGGKIEDDLRKLAKVRQLGATREYRAVLPVMEEDKKIKYRAFQTHLAPGPRTFLVTCGDEWAKPETYRDNVVEALKRIRDDGQDVWLHAAFSLTHGLLVFQPYTDFGCVWITENALMEFILRVNTLVGDFITDRIDLRRYLPTLEEHKLFDPADSIGSPTEYVPWGDFPLPGQQQD
jgi:hypothetical protein